MTLSIFALALVAPFLYAACNHVDNILLEKYFKEGGVGTLILFSALLSIIAIPVLWLIDPAVLQVGLGSMMFLLLVGIINVILLWSYLQAIFTDEPTVVIIYYQLVPVIGLVLGYFILGEVISANQFFAMATIIIGASILTFSLDESGGLTFRGKTAMYMLIASSCWALESTLFKMVAIDENVWRSLFWEHVALVLLGAFIFIIVPHYRDSFMKALRLNSKPVLGLNVLNESMFMVANSLAAYVVILIPVSLTLLMNSFQPLFVLAIGYALKWAFPRLEVEHVNNRNNMQKIVAIAVTGLGVYMLGGW